MMIKAIDFGGKLPQRSHHNDAGADVFVNIEEPIKLLPGESIKVPLGFGIELPDGMAAFVMPRSGLSSKGITTELAPIDSGYRGEIHAIVTYDNYVDVPYTLEPNTRVGQLVIVPIVLAEFTFGNLGEERGANGFGSTGTK